MPLWRWSDCCARITRWLENPNCRRETAATAGFGVVFVWQTLSATQDMARDTRRIGEAQTRAYVNVTEAITSGDRLTLDFKNFGNSPAIINFVDTTVHVYDPYANKHLWSQAFWDNGFALEQSATHELHFRLDRGRGAYIREEIRGGRTLVTVYGKFHYTDVFKNPIDDGFKIVLADGVE